MVRVAFSLTVFANCFDDLEWTYSSIHRKTQKHDNTTCYGLDSYIVGSQQYFKFSWKIETEPILFQRKILQQIEVKSCIRLIFVSFLNLCKQRTPPNSVLNWQ